MTDKHQPIQPELPGPEARVIRVFDALDLRPVRAWIERNAASAGVRAEWSENEEIRESYYDTEDWRLWRAGLSLQVRQTDNRVDATLQPVELPGVGASLPPSPAEAVSANVAAVFEAGENLFGGRLGALKGSRPLSRRLDLRIQACEVELIAADGQRCTLALHEMAIPVDESETPARLCRVVVHDAPAPHDGLAILLGALEHACALRASTMSRFRAAATARGVTPPAPPELGDEQIASTQSVAETAFAGLRRQFRKMLAEEPGTRLGEDIECLHDMRVATRRMRAALRLYREHLPARMATLNRELGWLGRTLGEVRDLDVQLATLNSWRHQLDEEDGPALDALRDWLQDRWVSARVRMLRALDSRRYERMVQRMTAALQRGPARGRGQQSVLEAAPQLIGRRYRKAIKLGGKIESDTPAAVYHRLRIRCKALRYALEFHAELYAQPAQRVIDALVALQDLLGDHQDADVAVDWLRGLSGPRGRRLPSETMFVAGKLAERFARRARRLRSRFPRRFVQLSEKNWRRLEQTMERAARNSGPTTHRVDARTRAAAGSTDDAKAPVESEAS